MVDMRRQQILKQAKVKREHARRLLQDGKSALEINRILKKKYKSGVGDKVFVELRQELAEEVVTLPPPAETVTLAPVKAQGDLQVKIGGIFNWMGSEGISRINLDLDSREVRLERTETIRC